MSDTKNTTVRPTAAVSRRSVIAAIPVLALAGCTAAASPTVSSATPETSSAGSSTAPGAANNKTVRLATVTTIQSGGLLDKLVADFQEKTGVTVEVYAGDDVYTQARAGKADLVFSHLGHKDAQAFLQDGLGQWPQAVLSNTIGYIIPPGDPRTLRAQPIRYRHSSASRRPSHPSS